MIDRLAHKQPDEVSSVSVLSTLFIFSSLLAVAILLHDVCPSMVYLGVTSVSGHVKPHICSHWVTVYLLQKTVAECVTFLPVCSFHRRVNGHVSKLSRLSPGASQLHHSCCFEHAVYQSLLIVFCFYHPPRRLVSPIQCPPSGGTIPA